MAFTFQPYRPYNGSSGSGNCDTNCIIILSSVFGGLFMICFLVCVCYYMFFKFCKRTQNQNQTRTQEEPPGKPYIRPLNHNYATSIV